MRRWLIAGVAVAALVAVAVVVAGPGRIVDAYEAWANRLQDEVAALPEGGTDGGEAPAASDSLLLTVSDDTGDGAAFAVLTTDSEGTPVLAVIPADLYDLVPGYGEFALGDSLRFEGPDLAALVVENALGIRIDASAVLPAGDLAGLFTEPVPVELASPLVETGEDGTIVRLAAEGNLGREGAVIAELFSNPGDGDQLAFLERQAATWEGVVRHTGSDPELAARVASLAQDPVLAQSLLTAAASDTLEVTLIPLSRVGGGAEEGFEVAAQELPGFIARRFAHLALRAGEERPNVELLNGNGELLSTRWAAESLVGRGFRVIRTDNADRFDFATTIVIAQGEEHTEDAAEVVEILGVGELRLELAAPSGIVDVSIIVGQDVPAGEG